MGAVVFYVLLRKPLRYFTVDGKRKWPKLAVIIVLMIFSFLILILPVGVISLMLSGKVGYIITHYADILRIADEWGARAESFLGVDVLTKETTLKLTTLAAGIIPDLLNATVNAVINVFVLYFILYFLLSESDWFENTVRNNLPFEKENNALLLSELKTQTVSNSIGIVVLALLQAITALLGYFFLGVDEPLFWATITGIMSVIPVAGTTIVWVPLAVFLYAGGNTWQCMALLLYGGVVITNIDNVFRFVVQKQLGDIHPLVTFFGVVIGLPLFGFVGLIFGPLLISYFLLLLKIYRNEYAIVERM